MSTSTKCAVLHNVQSYALLHVFAECCGQKCKGITQYHVFLCLIWLCCTLTPILFSSQRPIGVDEWRALPCCVPICIWVDIAPKREKIVEKWQTFFVFSLICYLWFPKLCDLPMYTECPKRYAIGKMLWIRRTLSRVRVTRAFQQRCWFFAVTSVTRGTKNAGQKVQKVRKMTVWKTCFSRFYSRNLGRERFGLLKYI